DYRWTTVKTYLKQQMGYGKTEERRYCKHPYRFNLLGQSRWLGRIYGELTTAVLSRRPVIYFGAFGRGLFQSLYEPPSSLLGYLPFTLEWNAVGILLFLSALVSPRTLVIGALPLVVSFGLAVATAARARVDPRFAGPASRALIALLTYLGPLVRGIQRYLWRLRGLGQVGLTRVSQLSLLGFGAAVVGGLLFHIPEIIGVGAALGLVNLGVIVAENVRLGRILNDALDIVAARIALHPLGAKRAAPRAQAA